MKSKFLFRRSIFLVIALLFVFGISSTVMAQADKSWGSDFQKEFGNLDYLNQNLWESDLENKAEIIQEGDENSAAIKQNGSRNSALIVQNGNFNDALITQSGNSNSAVIKQFSNNNSALISQFGSNNQAQIIQN